LARFPWTKFMNLARLSGVSRADEGVPVVREAGDDVDPDVV